MRVRVRVDRHSNATFVRIRACGRPHENIIEQEKHIALLVFVLTTQQHAFPYVKQTGFIPSMHELISHARRITLLQSIRTNE